MKMLICICCNRQFDETKEDYYKDEEGIFCKVCNGENPEKCKKDLPKSYVDLIFSDKPFLKELQ